MHRVLDEPSPAISRRRVLGVLAAATWGLLGESVAATSPAVRWRGMVLGAPATITLYHPDQSRAEAALEAVLTEIEALESIFSLYREGSALSRLNRTGELHAAPRALLKVLDCCRLLHQASDGAFDPTVQSLWTVYEEHYRRVLAAADGPSQAELASALLNVGLRRVVQDGQLLRCHGTQLTMNGIAQGYLTDRARDILATHGLPHALINLGEFRALGPRPDGSAWRLAITHPELPWRTLAEVHLPAGAALATSAAMGTAFDDNGRNHHLFDPRTGRSVQGWRSVTVQAADATLADGLSTALAVAPSADAARILAQFPDAGALLLGRDEKLHKLGNRLRVG
jgi:FAD:protein FMN transferase